MRNALLALSLFTVASFSHAADFKLALSNKTVAADYTSQPIGSGLELTLGGLHNTDHGNVFTTGLQVSQPVNDVVSVSLGGKLFAVLNDTKDASGLALGGQLDMALPNIPQIHFGAHGWFAPKVTSFNSTKNFRDFGAYVSYRVVSNAEVFAGYRHIRIDYENEGGLTIENGPQFGMKLFF